MRCSLSYVDQYPGPYVSAFEAVGDAPIFAGITERGGDRLRSNLSTPSVPFTTTAIWWTSDEFYVVVALQSEISILFYGFLLTIANRSHRTLARLPLGGYFSIFALQCEGHSLVSCSRIPTIYVLSLGPRHVANGTRQPCRLSRRLHRL